MFFLTNHHAPQIQTPPRSANVCPPTLHRPLHPDKRFALPDISPFLGCCFAAPVDDASSLLSHRSTIDNDRSVQLHDRAARTQPSRQRDFPPAQWETLLWLV